MLTKETALRIVKQAEEEYEQGNEDLVAVIASLANGWWYHDNRDLDPEFRRNDWQKFHAGMDTMESESSEEIAGRLAHTVNSAVKLLYLVHDREKKLHDVIMAYRALKADIKEVTEGRA
jgi:hypothetical protein